MLGGFRNKISEVPLKKTQYCIEVKCEDGSLLFHTLTGALLLLEKGDSFSAFEDDLTKHNFLIPKDTDELKYVNEYRSLISSLNPENGNITRYTILTSTDCNARCYYCYELGRKRISMTSETAKRVAAYIIASSGGEKVKLHWFGGEPLYNIPAIDTITSILAEHEIGFTSRITTNGFYMNKSVAHKAKIEWNTELVQITLDGTEKMYNRTKAYIDKEDNPYRKVMENIGYALHEGIHVQIRLNMDANNADNLQELIDELSKRFGDRDSMTIGVSFLRKFTGDIHPFDSDEEAISWHRTLSDRIERAGFNSKTKLQRNIRKNKCMADSDSSEVILPDGCVGRCEHFSESEIAGNIFDENRDEKMIQSWKEIAKPFDDCKKCALYPRCINLKKCEWDKYGCSPAVRTTKIDSLKKQILREYQEWKQKNTE